MGSTGMEPNGAAEVAFLNLGYFDATRFYWDPWAQKKSTASLFLDVRCNPDVAPLIGEYSLTVGNVIGNSHETRVTKRNIFFAQN